MSNTEMRIPVTALIASFERLNSVAVFVATSEFYHCGIAQFKDLIEQNLTTTFSVEEFVNITQLCAQVYANDRNQTPVHPNTDTELATLSAICDGYKFEDEPAKDEDVSRDMGDIIFDKEIPRNLITGKSAKSAFEDWVVDVSDLIAGLKGVTPHHLTKSFAQYILSWLVLNHEEFNKLNTMDVRNLLKNLYQILSDVAQRSRITQVGGQDFLTQIKLAFGDLALFDAPTYIEVTKTKKK